MKYKDNFVHMDDVEPFGDTCGQAYELAATPNISIAYITLSGRQGGKHLHKVMDELYFITAGKGHLTIEDERFELTKGQSVRIPKNVPHFIEPAEDETLELLVATSPKFDLSDVIEVE